jgi:hypothetical protein
VGVGHQLFVFIHGLAYHFDAVLKMSVRPEAEKSHSSHNKVNRYDDTEDNQERAEEGLLGLTCQWGRWAWRHMRWALYIQFSSA